MKRVYKVLPARWEHRVVWVLLVLPVALVLLAVWALLDPSARQGLRDLLGRLVPWVAPRAS